MSGLANYCPDEVSVLLTGFIPVEGFFEGTFVEINRQAQPFKSVVSADGQVSRLYTQSSVYDVRLTLMSSSGSNGVLTKLWQLDEITQMGKFPLLMKDKSGSDLFFSATTWIEELPSMSKSEVVGSRTWVLRSVEASINIGGNQGESGILQDLANLAIGALPTLGGRF